MKPTTEPKNPRTKYISQTSKYEKKLTLLGFKKIEDEKTHVVWESVSHSASNATITYTFAADGKPLSFICVKVNTAAENAAKDLYDSYLKDWENKQILEGLM